MARNPDMTASKRAPSAKPKKSPAAASPPPRLNVPSAPPAPAETERQAVGESEKAPVGAKGLLRAGLKALGEVRDDVVVRQSRIFEALLGIDTSALLPRSIDPSKNPLSADARFEDVFDQRVARSLERLGMPSPQALTALCRQLEAINEHLQRDHAPPPAKPAARKRRPAPKKT
jgi:hypothetical protein